MVQTVTVKQVHDILRKYARKRADIGVSKALLDGVLEPTSPFDSKGVRSPRAWFVLLSLLAAAMFICFLYFNRLW